MAATREQPQIEPDNSFTISDQGLKRLPALPNQHQTRGPIYPKN